jgi:hypothetical protein
VYLPTVKGATDETFPVLHPLHRSPQAGHSEITKKKYEYVCC